MTLVGAEMSQFKQESTVELSKLSNLYYFNSAATVMIQLDSFSSL